MRVFDGKVYRDMTEEEMYVPQEVLLKAKYEEASRPLVLSSFGARMHRKE